MIRLGFLAFQSGLEMIKRPAPVFNIQETFGQT
jgi:hypothetical protein